MLFDMQLCKLFSVLLCHFKQVHPAFWEWVVNSDIDFFVSYISCFKNIFKLSMVLTSSLCSANRGCGLKLFFTHIA